MAEQRAAERRVIVAGGGNVFLGDDGFGVEVVRQLAGTPLPAGVEVVDVGIRGVHLAYDLLDGCDLLILVDAAARGGPPGTVSVLDVAPTDIGPGPPLIDAHGLAPDDVLGLVRRLGGRPARTLVVTCEPADLEAGMDLSDPVREAVPVAVDMVRTLLGGSSGGSDGAKTGQAGTGGRGGVPGRPGAAGPPAVHRDVEDVRA